MFPVYIRVSVTRYYSGVIPKVLHEPHKPPFRKQQKNLRNGILPGIVRRDKKNISTSHFFRSFPNDARPEKKQRRGNVCIKGRIKTPNFWRRGDSSLHRQKRDMYPVPECAIKTIPGKVPLYHTGIDINSDYRNKMHLSWPSGGRGCEVWAFQQQVGAGANSRGAEAGPSSAALNPNN